MYLVYCELLLMTVKYCENGRTCLETYDQCILFTVDFFPVTFRGRGNGGNYLENGNPHTRSTVTYPPNV